MSRIIDYTQANATASDDFFVVDGATNNTRKLSAHSPSFGGGVTAAGASTLNGTSIPAGKTLVVTTDKISVLAATTSAELAGVITDETGTGALVFANSPILVTPNIGAATGTSVNLSGAGTFGGNLTVSGGTLAVTPSANDATATLKGRATGTNQLATSSRGSNVTLVNLDTTDNNCEAIAFQNSNELAIASIVAQNVSHTGRTGKLYVNISNGAAPAEALNIAADKTVTLAGNLTVSGTGTSTFSGILNVSGSTNYLKISTTGTPTSGAAALQLSFNGTNSRGIRLTNVDTGGRTYDIIAGGGGDAASFGLYDDTSGAYRMFITSGGNVLIGTTTDTGQKLQVSGTAAISGQIRGANIVASNVGSADAGFYGTAGGDAGSSHRFALVRTDTPSGGSALLSAFGGVAVEVNATSGINTGTRALTIDTSANATFAGNVKANGGYFQGPSGADLGVVAASGRNLKLYSDGGILGATIAAGTGDTTLAGNLTVSGAISGTAANSLRLANSGSGDSQLWATGPNVSTRGTFNFVVSRSDLSSSIGALAIAADGTSTFSGATAGTVTLAAGAITATGNLTVSGTGTTGGNLSVRNALGYATGIHTGTTSDSTQQLLLSSNAAYNHAYISKGSTALGIGFSSDNGSFVADDSITITAATKLVTLAGNLTVSGRDLTLGSSESVIYFGTPSANYLYYNGSSLFLRVGSVDRITIPASTGNVLIGTTTDGGQKLQVSGTANIGNPFSTSTDDSLILHGKAVFDGSGNYGDYGSIVLSSSSSFTASARRYLITNAYLATDFAIIRSTNATTTPTIGTNGVVSSGTVDFRISESGNATFAGNLTVSGTGTSSFSGPLTVSPGAIGGGYLNLNKDGADLYLETQRWTGVGSNFGATRITGSTSGGGFLTFSTSNETTIGAQTFTERMRLTSTGNVGIGTTSPSAKFVVSDGGANGLEVNPNASGRVLAESYSRSGATYVPFRLLSSTTIFNDTGGNVLIGTTTDAGGKLQIATGASNTLLIGNDATYTSYNQISLNGTRTNSGVLGMIGGGAGDSQLYLLAPTGGGLVFQIAASTVFSVNSSGNAAFAGQITASGISHKLGSGGTGAANAVLTIDGSSASSYGSYIVLQRNSTNKWQFGTYSGINGGTSDDFLLYNPTAANEALKIAAATSNATFAGTIALTGSSAGQVATWNSSNANGIYHTYLTNGTAIGDIGSAAQAVSGSASDFGITSRAGKLVLGTSSAARLTIDTSGDATFAGTVTLPNDKAIYFKQVGGTAQRFALNSGDVIYIEPDQLHKISIGGAGVTNVGVGGIGVAGNSVFGGTIAIGNTVNTVSPTSPNRTITMVIGGTTYYIHAKTTND